MEKVKAFVQNNALWVVPVLAAACAWMAYKIWGSGKKR